VETVIHKLDVRPGGLWLNEMKFGGGSHYQRVEYTEVDAPEKLVWLHSVSDGEWGIASNLIMPDWPRVPINGPENGANKSAPPWP
jgi:3-deoxy-D-manno-octulosonic-acid transferase